MCKCCLGFFAPKNYTRISLHHELPTNKTKKTEIEYRNLNIWQVAHRGWSITHRSIKTKYGAGETANYEKFMQIIHFLARGDHDRIAVHHVAVDPKDFTMTLTLSAKLFEVIFFPGTWKGLDTASTYAAWNLRKNWVPAKKTHKF